MSSNNPYAGMTYEELLKNAPPIKRKVRPEAVKLTPVVTLATSNPDVPLERQRERISEAQQRLIADEVRRLAELAEEKKREAWLIARQAAIDWHMEMKLANEEDERRFRRSDPCGYWSNRA
jgi:phage terminase small subunit